MKMRSDLMDSVTKLITLLKTLAVQLMLTKLMIRGVFTVSVLIAF